MIRRKNQTKRYIRLALFYLQIPCQNKTRLIIKKITRNRGVRYRTPLYESVHSKRTLNGSTPS